MEEDYTIGKIVGKGAFSVVKECTNKKTGKRYAVKIVEKKNPALLKPIANEIEILKELKGHPNIVKLTEVIDQQDNIFIVMELIKGGELYEELISNGPFDEFKVYQLFSQLVDALRYLHSKNIVHRDLKLQNILLTPDWKLKLTDFGLSQLWCSNLELMHERCGTPAYVAPEVIRGEDYDMRVDIWSLGVIFYLLLHVQYPYMGDGIAEIYSKIEKGDPDFPNVMKTPLSLEAKDLILNLLQVDPQKRLTLDQVLQHPWMRRFQSLDNSNSIGKS